MTRPAYPYARHLWVAGFLSLLGQATAIAFMLWPNPFTTFAFMTGGSGLILSGMALFAYALFRDVRSRTRSIAERKFKMGEFVFRQGDAGDRVYVVESGEVEVVRQDPDRGDAVVARLGKGEYFGEMALLSDAPRNASVRAATDDVVTLAIERHDFQSLFSGVPAFKQSVEAAMKARAR